MKCKLCNSMQAPPGYDVCYICTISKFISDQDQLIEDICTISEDDHATFACADTIRETRNKAVKL